MERHRESLQMEDLFHARTARAFRGGKIDDYLVIKPPEKETPLEEVGAKLEDVMQKLVQ
jgi:hypothetical protein